MQRNNTFLRRTAQQPTVDTTVVRNETTPTSARSARVAVMRERALLATIDRNRADLLTQLLNHLGNKAFASTLSALSGAQQVEALSLLTTDKRAALYRELSQSQRQLWREALKNGVNHPAESLSTRIMRFLRLDALRMGNQPATR